MPSKRAVFDTSVLVSAALFVGSIPSLAVEHAILHDRVLISGRLLFELTKVLLRRKFDRYTTVEFRMGFVEQLEARAELIATTANVQQCRDPNDNFLLDLAVDGAADLIVTGDKDLLVLNPFRGIAILSPAAFLAL